METPTVAELAAFDGRPGEPDGDQAAQYERCLGLAVEIVERATGPLSDRTSGVESCRTAILIIARHEFAVEQGVTGYRPSDPLVPSGGYLIPNRAATLIDTLRYDHPDSVGIG